MPDPAPRQPRAREPSARWARSITSRVIVARPRRGARLLARHARAAGGARAPDRERPGHDRVPAGRGVEGRAGRCRPTTRPAWRASSANKGEGFHHVCFEVDEPRRDAHPPRARRAGARSTAVPRKGAEGPVAFLHPRSCHGVLVELIEAPGGPAWAALGYSTAAARTGGSVEDRSQAGASVSQDRAGRSRRRSVAQASWRVRDSATSSNADVRASVRSDARSRSKHVRMDAWPALESAGILQPARCSRNERRDTGPRRLPRVAGRAVRREHPRASGGDQERNASGRWCSTSSVDRRRVRSRRASARCVVEQVANGIADDLLEPADVA